MSAFKELGLLFGVPEAKLDLVEEIDKIDDQLAVTKSNDLVNKKNNLLNDLHK